MTTRALQTAGAVLLVMFGIWAGARFYMSRTLSAGPAVQVPVGQASAPSPNDLMPEFNPEATAPRQIPDLLPAFALSDRAGRTTPISTWSGKSLVLNFWATWCAPCKREIPLLKGLDSTWTPRGFQVIGIAVDYPDKVAAFADSFKIGYPLLVGEQEALDVAAKLGMQTPVFPFTVFTDRQGQVVALFVGELHQAQADLILGEVEKVNTGGVDLARARQMIAEQLLALRQKSAG